MDGGHKSVGTGLTDYLGLRAHHTPHASLMMFRSILYSASS